MRRVWMVLGLVAAIGSAQEAEKPAPEGGAAKKAEPAKADLKKVERKKEEVKPILLRQTLRAGSTYIGSNSISFDLKMKVTRNGKTKITRESVERTERFRDHVKTASERGPLEIERMYQKLFTKVRVSGQERPEVDQSPLQGRTVTLTERRRNRRMQADTDVVIPAIVRKSAGVELDWRDILPREAVRPGDKWEADAERLARRIAVYLDSGTRSSMKVTFESIDTTGGRRRARLYVDWSIDGMRNRQLFTKVILSGEVLFDLDLQRFVSIDLAGPFGVQGATVTKGTTEIVNAQGNAHYKSTLHMVPVAAAAGGE